MNAHRTGSFEADLLSLISSLLEEQKDKSSAEEKGAGDFVYQRLAQLAESGNYLANEFLNFVACSQWDYSKETAGTVNRREA